MKKNYILYPEELIDELRMRRIFDVFDSDKSKALDIVEMAEMFKEFKINVTEE